LENQSTNWEKVGFVSGHGTTNTPFVYSFLDNTVSNGTYRYRLKQLDYDGTANYSEEVEVTVTYVYQYLLFQNYPNPFNPRTTIQFQIPSSADGALTTLKLYDTLGREVRTLVSDFLYAGVHRIQLDASTLANGVYYYTLSSIGRNSAFHYVDMKRLVVVK
jgi:hypothetical protein